MLGNGHSDASSHVVHPSWFKPESFLQPDFNPQTYVAGVRKYVRTKACHPRPDTLPRCLWTRYPTSSTATSPRSRPGYVFAANVCRHAPHQPSQLVEVINEDYNDFVSLSTKLVNIDGSVLRMQKPLLELKARLPHLDPCVHQPHNALGAPCCGAGGHQGPDGRPQRWPCTPSAGRGMPCNAGADAGHRARHGQGLPGCNIIALRVCTIHMRCQVEKLITEANDAGDVSTMSEDDLAAHARLLERVGGEMARLQFFSARGAQLAFMQQLAPRVARATTSAEARFSEALQIALTRGQHSTVTHCLHAFASISATAAGEAVVRCVTVEWFGVGLVCVLSIWA